MEDKNTYQERDLRAIAYLLLNREVVEYKGTVLNGPVVYALFSPRVEASRLVSEFLNERALAIQPKRILEAYDEAKKIIFCAREEAGVTSQKRRRWQ